MRTFFLNRIEDETGISGTGLVAEGVIWDDGAVALRWLTKVRSSGTYASLEDVETIHGHGGRTIVMFNDGPFHRGIEDAYQDRCEGCLFGSVGAKEVFEVPAVFTPPDYIPEPHRLEYLKGYEAQIAILYGHDWRAKFAESRRVDAARTAETVS